MVDTNSGSEWNRSILAALVAKESIPQWILAALAKELIPRSILAALMAKESIPQSHS